MKTRSRCYESFKAQLGEDTFDEREAREAAGFGKVHAGAAGSRCDAQFRYGYGSGPVIPGSGRVSRTILRVWHGRLPSRSIDILSIDEMSGHSTAHRSLRNTPSVASCFFARVGGAACGIREAPVRLRGRAGTPGRPKRLYGTEIIARNCRAKVRFSRLCPEKR